MNYKWIILVVGLISFGCDKPDLACDLPPPNWFSIDIQDENENSLFNNVFSHDSIQLYHENDTVQLLWWVSAEQMQIGFESIESEKDYFLELSSLDTDTLWVKWSSSGDLCQNYFLDSLRYNDMAISKSELIGNDISLTK